MKSVLENNHQLAQDEIARSAYLLWEREGRPEGHALEHWMQAEARLLAAGRIVLLPNQNPAPPDVDSKSSPQCHRYGLVLTPQRRYGLVLTQKHSS